MFRIITRNGRPSRRACIMSAWFYILRLKSDTLHCGATHKLRKRIQEHFQGRACRTTAIDPPVSLVHTEVFDSFSKARKRELQVKRWTGAKKEALIAGDLDRLKKLAKRKKERKTS